MTILKLGGSKKDITPPIGVPLAGFMHRTETNLGTIRKLQCRVWVLQHITDEQSRTSLVIQADLIWWGSEQVSLLKDKIEQQFEITPEQIMFHASHTHSGPQTSKQLHPSLGVADDDYLAFLDDQVLGGITEAIERLEEVTVEKGLGRCEQIGINRRKQIDGQLVMAPNPDAASDDEITVLKFIALSGQVKAVWFHFTCHPTVTDLTYANSEYCGAAMELIDQQFGDGVSCFLQGCCGDIRPALVKDNAFYRGDDGDVQRLGYVLSKEILKVLDHPMQPLSPINEIGKSISSKLYFQNIESDYRLLHLQLLPIAKGCSLLGINGEAVVDYGLYIKAISNSSILPLGYSNGMIGYLPTERQIHEGGYESVDSVRYFLLPGPFTLDIENIFKNTIINIAGKEEVA